MTRLVHEYTRLYHALCDVPPSVGRVQRARLLAIIEASGSSVTGLSVWMGKAKPTLMRKLCAVAGSARPLTHADVDEILDYLEVDYTDMLGPVLTEEDRLMLVKVGKATTLEGHYLTGGLRYTDELARELSVLRLRSQCLVSVGVPYRCSKRALALTALGRDIYDNLD